MLGEKTDGGFVGEISKANERSRDAHSVMIGARRLIQAKSCLKCSRNMQNGFPCSEGFVCEPWIDEDAW